ncbi:MAG: AlpA family transcriptional regulator [Gammaproteobacteria bacterium]|nr:AlpA family transcriptional regulator [Gammaproteobacteria bacterium]
MKPEQNQQTHYLKDKNVAARYDIDRTTVWRWVSEGRLPTPHKIHGVTRWRLSKIEECEQQGYKS